MRYFVGLSGDAARQLRTLDRPVRARLVVAIEGLANDPLAAGVTKLAGEEIAWRIRVGDHRVLYDVLDDALVVTGRRRAQRWEVRDR